MKERKLPIIERICRAIDVPPESVSHTPLIEIHGRSLLKINDGGRILLYTEEKIRIEMPKTRDILTVTGKDLSCAFYNLGAVGIEGKIEGISFVEENGERERK